jgi:hypothetical protein
MFFLPWFRIWFVVLDVTPMRAELQEEAARAPAVAAAYRCEVQPVEAALNLTADRALPEIFEPDLRLTLPACVELAEVFFAPAISACFQSPFCFCRRLSKGAETTPRQRSTK